MEREIDTEREREREREIPFSNHVFDSNSGSPRSRQSALPQGVPPGPCTPLASCAVYDVNNTYVLFLPRIQI